MPFWIIALFGGGGGGPRKGEKRGVSEVAGKRGRKMAGSRGCKKKGVQTHLRRKGWSCEREKRNLSQSALIGRGGKGWQKEKILLWVEGGRQLFVYYRMRKRKILGEEKKHALLRL